ncbi:DsrE family protein [Thiomicrorhabdus sp. 6S3-12]|uniref:DsrE family protein n=1 Tax=Thiomicrorhabdus sp. 6S3-12 TaxID=2819681 RepID=UPI001FB6821E|nr:DsrE family protein [Thiomicrorhabdus sp. 6S3-12]
MQGLKSMHVIYDIRKSTPNAMLVYLKGIESNRSNLIKEGVEPHQRIVFIARSVKFITTQPSEEVEMQYGPVLEKVAAQIARLVELGVKMEVCSAATAAFNVDNDTLLPGIKPVRSGFLSVMGWQAQGYQLVPVYD